MDYTDQITQLLAEKRNSELILDSLSEIIIAHDLDRRITFFNRAAEKLTGLSREEVLGRDCHQVIQGGLCGNRCTFCTSCVPNFEPEHFPLLLTDAGGQEHRLEMTLLPITDREGKVVGALASARDVTELVELRRALGRERSFRGIIGRHPSMQQVFELIRQVAPTDMPVLIQGESGTGKELVAAAIHAESPRAGRPFVAIHCAALPEGLLESELFGHVRGAFTGAVRDRRGRLELAHGGTVFLDEVGELSQATQVKLLRVLQEKQFERVGAEETIRVDIRLLSASNRDLKRLVREGKFREDLYYRLCVVPLELPPLRERKTDIPLLAKEFLERFCAELHRDLPEISPVALKVLMDYHWPGNVRELINTLQYTLVMCRGQTIEKEHLPAEIFDRPSRQSLRPGRPLKISPQSVEQTLAQTNSKDEAARRLGISRATLYRYLKRIGLSK
jgi:PAS domain S-box-containing protein